MANSITRFFGPGGNPFLQSATIYTFGQILASLTTKTPTIRKTADEKFKERLLGDFKKVRERRNFAANLASSISGRPVDDFLRGKDNAKAVEIIKSSGKYPDFELFPVDDIQSSISDGVRVSAGPVDQKVTETGKGPSTPEEQEKLTEEITTQATTYRPFEETQDYKAWKSSDYADKSYKDYVKNK